MTLPFTQLELLSLFEKHEGEFQQLPWQSQSPDLDITELLWSVFDTRVRNKFPLLTTLKKLQNVLEEKCYKISLETSQNLYNSIQIRTVAVLKIKRGPTPY
jgi:hypothetical protein